MKTRPAPPASASRWILSVLALAAGWAIGTSSGLWADEEQKDSPEARAGGPGEGPRDGERPRPEGSPRDGERPRPEGAPERGPGEGPRPEGPERERRLRALHHAAEILQEAGLHPQAMALREQAERMMQEFRDQPHGEGAPRPPHPGGDLESLRREMAELREIVADLRRQVRGGPEGSGPEKPREGDRPRPDGERPRPDRAPDGGPDRGPERERGDVPKPEGAAPREGSPERR